MRVTFLKQVYPKGRYSVWHVKEKKSFETLKSTIRKIMYVG